MVHTTMHNALPLPPLLYSPSAACQLKCLVTSEDCNSPAVMSLENSEHEGICDHTASITLV